MSARILIIEDEQQIADLLTLHLKEHGFLVSHRMNGREGLEEACREKYSLVLLDLNLPEMPGVDVCRELRRARPTLPIMILSSNDSELDKVLGLELGADDYITKPFSIHEVMARISTRLREYAPIERAAQVGVEGAILRYEGLSIDLMGRAVTVRGADTFLTAMEFDFLAFLAGNPGRAFTKAELLEAVWGVSPGDQEQSVTAIVQRIRKKVEIDSENPEYILTVRTVGYKFGGKKVVV